MRTFQFSVCLKDADPPIEVRDAGGLLVLTPNVSAEAITEAMNHAEVQNFCNTNQYRIYRQVK